MNTQNYLKQAEQFSAHNYHPLPVVLVRGAGVWVWDDQGNKYLDCLSAYSALNQGHCHPRIVEAMITQAKQLAIVSRAFHHDQMGNFLERLCKITHMDKALPMNSGAEAVETAIKAARKWGYTIKGIPENQAEIIVCANNFHGRTTGIISFSSEPQYRTGFGPFMPGFKIIPYGNIQALEQAITPHTAGFLVEPIQGEAGIILPPDGYLSQAKMRCQQNRVLFILDEIQTGLGRTGKLFAYEYEHAKPDLLILGKALSGGMYPVSALVANEEVMQVFHPGDHGSTFGGNPLASRVARVALDVILEEHLPERAAELGALLQKELQKIESPHIQAVRGKGLLIGIEIKKSSGPARPFCEGLMKLGILAKETHEQVIRLAPPLVIEPPEIALIVAGIREVLHS